MRENRSSHLVGRKTHPTILPRPGIERTTFRRIHKNIIKELCDQVFRILIDDRLLNWKQHMKCSKLSKCIAIIYKAKQLLGKESLEMLYNSLFVPYLTYCSDIYQNNIKVKMYIYLWCKTLELVKNGP